MSPEEVEQFKNWGVGLPARQPHGTDYDIRANLQRLQPRKWKLRGNELIGETDMGPLVQRIPPNYILTGTDEAGLPILVKIDTL